MAEEQNKRLRERERGSGESCERMNEMNSNYFHTDTSLREYIYTITKIDYSNCLTIDS